MLWNRPAGRRPSYELATTVICCLFVFGFGARALASSLSGLTIDGAVTEGTEKSPETQKAEAGAEEAGWKKTETLSGFLPSISFNANHYLKEKYQLLNIDLAGSLTIFPTIYPTTTAQLNAVLPIFDGLQNVYTLSAADFERSAAEEMREWTHFRVAQRIRLDFLKALAAQALEAVSEENLKTITDHLNQTESLKKGGVATNYDVLRVQVQLSEAKSGVLQANDNVTLARRQLAIAMGLDGDERALEGDLPVPNSGDIERLRTPENLARADLAALEDRAEAGAKRQSAAATWIVPRVSLIGNWTEYNDQDSSWSNVTSYRSAYNFGVALSWNIFDGMASISRAKEAIYQRIQAEKSLDQAKLQVPYDFEFWKRRYLYSSALYASRKSDVQASEESVRLAREGFRAGTRTSTEVLDAELDLFRARAGVVNAQIDCAEAEINLELAVGRKI